MEEIVRLLIISIIDGLAFAMLLFLIASGLSIIFGLMDILNFAHAGFFMLGAYVALTLFEHFNHNFVVAVAGAALFGMVLGVTIEYLTLRRLHGQFLPQILLTVGYLLIFTQVVIIIWGHLPKLFRPEGLTGTVMVLGLRIFVYRVFLIVFGLIVAASTYIFLTRTRLGMVVRAGTEDTEMVEALGINVKRTFTLIFGLGTALAALGGAVAVPLIGATPEMGSFYLMISFVVTVVGGMGSFKGAVFGSILIGIMHQLTAFFIPELTFVIDFLVLAGVLLIKPEGLFGIGE